MEKIIIKNFGPIKDVELEIKDINVFIGSTSSGKSTVAKLIAIFKDSIISDDIEFLRKELVNYNIDFSIEDNTYIRYDKDDYFWELEKFNIRSNYPLEELESAFNNTFKKLKKAIDVVQQLKKGKDFSDSPIINQLTDALIFAEYKDFIEKNRDKLDAKRVKEALSIIDNAHRKRKSLTRSDESTILRGFEEFSSLTAILIDSTKLHEINYIPAERILLSMIAESIFGLMNSNVTIAQCIKDFGAQFESARKNIGQLSIPFLDSEYSYSDKYNFVTFADGAKVKLEQASSGLQSIIPLLLVIESNTIDESVIKKCFVIEEPELNLYPTVQKELIEFIIERINKSRDKLVITTHSPYVLTSLDNLIQASNAAKMNPEQKEKVEEIVPEEKWVDFDWVTCYYFENGTCRSTLNTENQTIGASNIDDVSEELGKTFDQLLELKYAHVS